MWDLEQLFFTRPADRAGRRRVSLSPPPVTSQILQDMVFEGLPPDAQFVRSETK